MVYSDKYASAAQLTGVARAAFETAFNRFPLSAYFPLKNQPTRFFQLEQTAAVAPERATKLTGYNTTAPRGDDSAGGRVLQGRIVRTSESKNVDEMSLIQSPTADQLTEWQTTRARDIGGRMGNRARIMVADTLLTGRIDVSESGYNMVIDFNRPAENTVTLTAAKRWTAPESTPLADAKAWREITGGVANQLFVPNEVFLALQKNVDLIKRTLRRGSDLVDDISTADVVARFAEEGFVLRVLDRSQNDIIAYDGTLRNLIPGNMAFLLPAANVDPITGNGIGELHVGPTVESENSMYGISVGERPGVFAAASHEDDPEGWRVRGAGEFLTLLRAPAAYVTAKVAA